MIAVGDAVTIAAGRRLFEVAEISDGMAKLWPIVTDEDDPREVKPTWFGLENLHLATAEGA